VSTIEEYERALQDAYAVFTTSNSLKGVHLRTLADKLGIPVITGRKLRAKYGDGRMADLVEKWRADNDSN